MLRSPPIFCFTARPRCFFRFDTRHRAGYARMFNYWAEVKSIQPDDPTVLSELEIEERYKRRNNLVFMSQSGYNYDREREEGEGDDWGKPLQHQG
jgi:hypothetical protein